MIAPARRLARAMLQKPGTPSTRSGLTMAMLSSKTSE